MAGNSSPIYITVILSTIQVYVAFKGIHLLVPPSRSTCITFLQHTLIASELRVCKLLCLFWTVIRHLPFTHPPTLCNYKNTLFVVSESEGCQGLNNTLPLCDILRGVAMRYCLDNMPCQGSRKFICQWLIAIIMPVGSSAHVLNLLRLLILHDTV
jgi:hypothetical protein